VSRGLSEVDIGWVASIRYHTTLLDILTAHCLLGARGTAQATQNRGAVETGEDVSSKGNATEPTESSGSRASFTDTVAALETSVVARARNTRGLAVVTTVCMCRATTNRSLGRKTSSK